MKDKIFHLILIIGIITVGTTLVILIADNKDLNFEINKRDKLIAKTLLNDSINCEHTEKYVNTVTKYITKDCELIINEKKVTLDEFISIYSNEIKENNKLRKKEFDLNDTIKILKYQIDKIKKKYPIKLATIGEKGYLFTNVESLEIDSALVLLPFFRNRMSYDRLKNQWKVVMP